MKLPRAPLRPAIAAVVAAFCAIGASVPAAAEVRAIGRYGFWSVHEGTAERGDRLCGVSTVGAAPERRFFAVRFFPDGGYLEVQVSKKSWSIPPGTKVPLEIEFNGYPGAWRAPGGSHGEGDMIFQSFGRDAAVNFLREFRGASSGVIRFGGNEGTWTMNLTGSSAAVGALLDCIRRAHGGATQPYAAQPREPTRPYTPSAEPPVTVPSSIGTGRERRT
jgi:hypothetical protein